ncbi:hypothetical protein Esti_005603 [Eimeria stiedai]
MRLLITSIKLDHFHVAFVYIVLHSTVGVQSHSAHHPVSQTGHRGGERADSKNLNSSSQKDDERFQGGCLRTSRRLLSDREAATPLLESCGGNLDPVAMWKAASFTAPAPFSTAAIIAWKPQSTGAARSGSQLFALGWQGSNATAIFCLTGTKARPRHSSLQLEKSGLRELLLTKASDCAEGRRPKTVYNSQQTVIVAAVGLPSGATLAHQEWSYSGSYLFMLCDSKQKAFIWRDGSGSFEATELAHKDITAFAANPRRGLLALGTAKGGVILHTEGSINTRKNAAMYIHHKAVRNVAWIDGDLLLTASDEGTVLVLNDRGTVLMQAALKGEIRSVAVACQRVALATAADEILMVRTEASTAIEVQCGSRGECKLIWLDNDHLAAVSRRGDTCIIRVNWSAGMATPLQPAQLPCATVEASALSSTRSSLAVAYGGRIAVVSNPLTANIRSLIADLRPTDRGEAIVALAWSPDDQFLTAVARDGSVVSFAWPKRLLWATFGGSLLLSRSLTTLALQDATGFEFVFNHPLDSQKVCLGPTHCAVSHGEQITFYRRTKPARSNSSLPLKSAALEFCRTLSFPAPVELIGLGARYAVVVVASQALAISLIAEAHADVQPRPLHRTAYGRIAKTDQNQQWLNPVAIATASWWCAVAHTGGVVCCHELEGGFIFDEFHHFQTIRAITVSSDENHLGFTDQKGSAFVYFLGTSVCLALNLESIGSATDLIWDTEYSELLLVITSSSRAAPFKCCAATAYEEEQVIPIPVLQLQKGHASSVGGSFCTLDEGSVPVALHEGVLKSVSFCGALSIIPLTCVSRMRQGPSANETLAKLTEPSSVTIEALLQLVALERQEGAVDFLKERLSAEKHEVHPRSLLACFEAVGWNALHALSLSVARRAFAAAGRSDMVAWITRIEDIEELLALRAHLKALYQHRKESVGLLCSSGDPEAALGLACLVGELPAAIELVKASGNEQSANLQQWHAILCERENAFSAALAAFSAAAEGFELQMRKCRLNERAKFLSSTAQKARVLETKRQAAVQTRVYKQWKQQQLLECLQGKVRCSLKAGELHKGVQLAVDLDDPCIYRECALVLLRLGHKTHGATMLHKAGATERAAVIYIQLGEFGCAAPLVRSVGSSASLMEAHAHAFEQQRPLEALRAYGRIQDFTSMVRIMGLRCGRWGDAKALVRRTRDLDAALLIAECCYARSDFRGAVEMLCVAGKEERAITLAEAAHEIATLAEVLTDEASPDQHFRVSELMEHQRLFSHSARHRALAHRPQEALELFLKAGEAHWEEALDMVVRQGDPQLAERLKEEISTCWCLMNSLACRSGHLLEAAEISLMLAGSYKKRGQFTAAHGQLLKSLLILEKTTRGLNRTVEERQCHGTRQEKHKTLGHLYSRSLHNFALLHFYLRIPRLLERGNRYEAALLLIRLSSYISEFEASATQLLTSTLLIGAAAGFSASAASVAGAPLLRPENKSRVAAQHKRALERILRSQHPDTSTRCCRPCLECATDIEEDALCCHCCQCPAPLCAASGLHLTGGHCAVCPVCHFPINAEALREVEAQPDCPVCGEPLDKADWLLVPLEEAASSALYIRPLA